MLDVLILNAYHRGDWLSDKLKSSSFAVEELDVSALIGPRDDADLLSPFGFFEGSHAITEEWLLRERGVSFQKQGWVLWSDLGTYESSGRFRNFQFEKGSEFYEKVLKSWRSTIDRPPQALAGVVKPAETRKGYLISKNFSKPTDPRRTLKPGEAFDYVDEPGRKFVSWKNHTFEANFLVSFLLPHELMGLANVGLSRILTREPLRPRQCWQRFRARLETTFQLGALPDQLMSVDHLLNPWIEENFLVLQKSPIAGEWDIWYRTWYDIHKDQGHFSEIEHKVTGALRKKIPDLRLSVTQAPAEVKETRLQSLYPIYDFTEWSLQTKWYAKGIFAAGYDKCESFDLEQAVGVQQRILQQIGEELKSG